MSARIELRLYGSLRKFRPLEADRFPVKPGTAIVDLLGGLGIPHAKVNLTFLNGVRADLGAVVGNGDVVGIFPHLGGG